MAIHSRNTGMVNMSWEFEMFTCSDYIFRITDLSTSTQLDMLIENSYSYWTEAGERRDFLIGAFCMQINENQTYPEKAVMLWTTPNPFNSSLNITYSLPYDSDVVIDVRDITGHKVGSSMDFYNSAGMHEISWSTPEDIQSGLYFLTLRTPGKNITKRVVFLK